MVEVELSSKLRSVKLVLASKDFNLSKKIKVEVDYGVNNVTIPFKRFRLPPQSQFILVNVKKALQGEK